MHSCSASLVLVLREWTLRSDHQPDQRRRATRQFRGVEFVLDDRDSAYADTLRNRLSLVGRNVYATCAKNTVRPSAPSAASP